MQILVEGLKIARQIASSAVLDPYRGDEHLPGTENQSDRELRTYIQGHASTLYHPVGTCKMGLDPQAVVDPDCRVHGIQGLRVIDASIMPLIPRGNTNAPTIMIAEKGADLIRSESEIRLGLPTH